MHRLPLAARTVAPRPAARQPAPAGRPAAQAQACGCACGGGCPACTAPASASRSASADEAQADQRAARWAAPPGRRGLPHPVPRAAAGIGAQALRGPGQPLPLPLRHEAEAALGLPLAAARLHTDAAAAVGARALGAQAYAQGPHIAFAAGAYAPHTPAGRWLLGHELAHTAQPAGPLRREPAPAGTEAAPDDEQARKAKALAEAKAHPFISGLISEIVADLRWGRDFSDAEHAKLQLHGTEGAALWALAQAPMLAGLGSGGLRMGRDPGQALSITGTYFSALEPLTPSKTLMTDIPSLMLGLRIDEYLASDTFMKRLKDNAHTVAYLAAVAQVLWSGKVAESPAGADAAGLTTALPVQHLGLATQLLGVILKEKLTPPDIFDSGALLTPTHPAYARDNDLSGTLPRGLTADAATGAGGSVDFMHFGGALNLPRLVGADTTGDPRQYRGGQATVFGDYQKLVPTSAQAAQGRVPDARFRGGLLAGGDGLFALGEVGGRFSGAQADRLSALFGSAGLAYAPGSGPLRKLGFKVTHMGWQAGDSAAPGGVAGSATRFSPFAAVDAPLGGGHSLALSGGAGLAFGHQGMDVSEFSGSLAYTYLGLQGTAQLPTFRIELSGSGQRLDWQNPDSAMLLGARARVQTRQFFAGGQVNWGADDIPAARAAQLPDPRSDLPAPVGGTSVLVVAGFLTP